MSALTLSKLYGDMTLLFKADIDTMWDELESKTNGDLDASNVNAGWASWNQITLDKDTDYSMGTTESGIIRFYSATNEFVFAHDTTARSTIFKIGGTEVARIDTSANFMVKKDVFFYNRNTTYGLMSLLGYQKPVLVYIDGTTIDVEQNTTTDDRTLIVFPAGPIHVSEDTAVTHKFRRLKTSATANGYAVSHTGAADSGMKVGVTLTANTWYFVYAVIVRGGDDAGNSFLLVVDSTSPVPANWSGLDTAYGSGGWVYLGLFRYGHGGAATTTMIPFLQDHQGWHTFTGRAATDNFFGIRVASTTVTTTAYADVVDFSSAANQAPANVSMVKGTARVIGDGDSDIMGNLTITDSGNNILQNLPSFGVNLNTNDEAHGWEWKMPNLISAKLRGRRGTGSTTEDFAITAYIAAVLDEWL